MKRTRPSLMIIGFILSTIGFIIYGHFIYIATLDPNLSISEYNPKYFSNYLSWIAGIDKTNIAIIIIIAASIVLITASGYLSSRFRILARAIQGLNIIVFSMLVMGCCKSLMSLLFPTSVITVHHFFDYSKQFAWKKYG